LGGPFPINRDLGLPNSLAQAVTPAPTEIDRVLAVQAGPKRKED
jgi:hypothetical protein